MIFFQIEHEYFQCFITDLLLILWNITITVECDTLTLNTIPVINVDTSTV